MEQVKVIFLDVDGVLNSRRTTRRTSDGYLFVGSRKMKNLQRIVRETGAKVVLSSDWRYGRENPECNGSFRELQEEMRKYGIRFYGFTPELPSFHRGVEIDLMKEGLDMAKWCSDQELFKRETMCETCESKDCVYNRRGVCYFPLVSGARPKITDNDGCVNYFYAGPLWLWGDFGE